MKEILDQILNVSNEELNILDTNFISQYNFFHDTSYFHGKAGNEHYRLLMYISGLFRKQIVYDVGTCMGMSAAALSYSMRTYVKTYDIVNKLAMYPLLPNVEFIIGDVTQADLNKSPFIFFDVEHNGIFENIFYNHLHSINWKGFLVLDDINLSDMKIFWDQFTEEKFDLTPKGHWSGTGLVYFK